MSRGVQVYTEPLDDSELRFLTRKELKDRKLYYKIYRVLMFMSFLIPFAGAWYQAASNQPHAFSAFRYFFSVSVLLFISTFSTYLTYRYNLRKVQHDIKCKTKTLEVNHIRKKQHVIANGTYHFYIHSSVKLSIEVAALDFERYAEGDEIIIEYTTYSKEYLGYF